MLEEHVWKNGWQFWDLVQFLKEVGALGSSQIYRGQGNAKWNLIPSLYRREVHIYGEMSREELYVIAEEKMLKHFFYRAANLLSGYDRHPILDRIIAQHYGVPTQLLDWTIDPFIAIFFAVQGSHDTSDGALFFVSPMRERFLEARIEFPYKDGLTLLTPPVLDERIKMQKSVFTIQDYGSSVDFEPLDERSHHEDSPSNRSTVTPKITKVIIPHDRKKQVRLQLLGLGVDSSLMFPGLQGIGERIADYANIQQYGGIFLQ